MGGIKTQAEAEALPEISFQDYRGGPLAAWGSGMEGDGIIIFTDRRTGA